MFGARYFGQRYFGGWYFGHVGDVAVIIESSDMSLYAPDGSFRVTVVSGTGWKGVYAPDGSYWVTEAPSPVTKPVGRYAPDGSWYVTGTSSDVLSMWAPDGSLYVNTLNDVKKGMRITLVSGSISGL